MSFKTQRSANGYSFFLRRFKKQLVTATLEGWKVADKARNLTNSIGHSKFVVAEWLVDPASLSMTRGERTTRIEPRVMQVLVFLAQRPGDVVSREELEASVWKGRVVGYDALANTIIKLRKAFGDDSRQPRIIETISKKGYRLIAEVTAPASTLEPTTSEGSISEIAVASSISGKVIFWWAIPALFLVVLTAVVLKHEAPGFNSLLPGTDASTLSALPSIAVLPFSNISYEEEQQYFADGITEDLITDLSKLPGLLVVARNSVFAYKGSSENEHDIGRELGARYLLKGSIRKERDRVRVNVRLVDAAQGRNLWAERFDRELTGLFEIQDHLASRIVEALKMRLDPQVQRRLRRSYVTNIEAYDEFLRGIDYYGRRSRQDIETAEAHFKSAIKLDPDFARAYSALALTKTRVLSDGLGDGELGVLAEAEKLVEQALAIDESIPQVYFVKSQIELFRGNPKDALRTMERAVDLKPSYADGYGMMAWILHFAGRPQDGLKALEVAERLNPRIPSLYHLVRGANLYAVERYTEAVEVLEKASIISSQDPLIRLWLAAAYTASGNITDASWQVEELAVHNPAISLGYLRRVFPFKDPVYLGRLTAHLQQAGLAD